MDSESKIICKSKRNCIIDFDSCFERLGGYLTIPFKQVLKNLPLFRGQSVKETRLKSLKVAWKSKDKDYVYLVSILRKLGHKPEFPNVPKYNQLWAFVNAGRLIGEDVSQWEGLLEKETQRLREIQKEYEPKKEALERDIAENRARIAAIKQVQEELDAAMSRKLGY